MSLNNTNESIPSFEIEEILLPFREELEILKSEIQHPEGSLSPIELFQDFCEKFTDVLIQRDDALATPFQVTPEKIVFGPSFTYQNIPQLIQKLDSWDQELDFTQKLQEKYREKAKSIMIMLRQPIWNADDEATRDARKIWSRKAYFSFLLSQAYQGHDVFQKSPDSSAFWSKQFEAFLKTIPKDALLSEKAHKQTRILERIQKRSVLLHQKNKALVREFLEYYASKSDFHLKDMEFLKKESQAYIDSFSDSDLSDHHKEKIKNFIESFSLAPALYTLHKERTPQAQDSFEKEIFGFVHQIQEKLNAYQNTTLQKECRKELSISEENADREMQQMLEEDFTDMLFENAEKKLWEDSDMPQIFKENFGKPEFIDYIQDHFEATFPSQWKSLSQAQKALQDAREKKDIPAQTKLQIQIAQMLGALVFSEKFWGYEEFDDNFEDILNKSSNCVTRSQIFHQIYKEFFGEDTLSGTVLDHTFSILPLADGRFLKLDYPLEILKVSPPIKGLHYIDSNTENHHNSNWVSIQEHKKLYKANLLNNLITLSENYSVQQKIFLAEKALEEDPNNLTFWEKLLYQYGKNGNRKKFDSVMKKLLALDPQNIYFPILHIMFLYGNFKDKKEALKKLQEFSEKFPRNINRYIMEFLIYREEDDFPKMQKSYEQYQKIRKGKNFRREHIVFILRKYNIEAIYQKNKKEYASAKK